MTHSQGIDYIPSGGSHSNATAYDRRYSKATAYNGVGYISVQYSAGLNQDVRARTEEYWRNSITISSGWAAIGHGS